MKGSYLSRMNTIYKVIKRVLGGVDLQSTAKTDYALHHLSIHLFFADVIRCQTAGCVQSLQRRWE